MPGPREPRPSQQSAWRFKGTNATLAAPLSHPSPLAGWPVEESGPPGGQEQVSNLRLAQWEGVQAWPLGPPTGWLWIWTAPWMLIVPGSTALQLCLLLLYLQQLFCVSDSSFSLGKSGPGWRILAARGTEGPGVWPPCLALPTPPNPACRELAPSHSSLYPSLASPFS